MRERIIEAAGGGVFEILIPAFPTLLTITLFVACWLTLREARKQGLSDEQRYQAVFLSLLFVLPGARLIYALQYPEFYADGWSLFSLKSGGLALYGGLLGVVVPAAIYLHRQGIDPRRYLDALTPALACGIFTGRLGCFLAGCNWGQTTGLPWGVCFPGPKHAYAQHLNAGLIDSSASLSLPVHPTQLYESFFGLLMLIPIYYLLRRPHQPGFIFWNSIAAYAAFRFLIEFLRADSAGMGFGPLTFAQGLSLIVFCGTILLQVWPSRRSLANGRAEVA